MRKYWKSKRTGIRYTSVDYIKGTNLVEVTTEQTSIPYLVKASNLVLVVEK